MIKFYILIFLLTLAEAVFVTLKITSNIDWSWWWVLTPLVIPDVFWSVSYGILWLLYKDFRG